MDTESGYNMPRIKCAWNYNSLHFGQVLPEKTFHNEMRMAQFELLSDERRHLPILIMQDGHTIYMGKDKYENEDLIRYGIPEDVWFHVDNLSSAHVYLRMNRGEKV